MFCVRHQGRHIHMIDKMDKYWKSGVVLVVIFCSFWIFSCKKDGETKAVITVNDASGHAVEGAEVTLWQDTSVNQSSHQQANIRVTKTSDASGNAEFVFALEAYLNISAVKDTNEARGFVRLKEHETVNQTVHF